MQGAGYFHWLSLLDTNVAVVLTLMTIVAVATLISGMLILILDKKRIIGVVRAMGASIGNVRRIFIYLALKVALIGMLTAMPSCSYCSIARTDGTSCRLILKRTISTSYRWRSTGGP